MAVGDIVQLRTEVNFGQIRSINNFTFAALTSTPTWADRIADKWIDDVAGFFASFLSPDAVHDELELHDIVGSDPHRFFIDIIPPIAGGLGGAPTAGQACAKVTWYVEGSHRSQRGRSYLAGIANDQIDGSRRINGSVDTLIRAWADTVMGLWGPDGTESGARLCILSRQLNGVPRVPPVANPVMEYNVPNIIGTQRNRLK